MRSRKILKTTGARWAMKVKTTVQLLPVIALAASVTASSALAQHGDGRMGGQMGGGGGGGWMDAGGGTWIWTVIAVLIVALLVVMISKQSTK